MTRVYLTFYTGIILLMAGCVPVEQSQESQTDSFSLSPNFQTIDDAVHFYVLGDWGRKGQFGQQELANMMQLTGFSAEPEFIVSTGDNFYPNGVASIDDPNWEDSFEDVFNGFFLNCPWYVVLGNHDYRGSIEAEINYTYKSQRWNMPAQYFHQDFEDEGLKIRMVFLDTQPFELEYYKEEKYKKVWDQDTTAQLKWMDSILSDNSADWKIVVGHHPMYTGGKRIDEENTVRNQLEKYLIKHEVDVYFAGHEHDIQFIKPDGPTYHIVSGAGSEVRPTGKLDITEYAESVQAFVSVSATSDSLYCQVVNYMGEVMYTKTIN